MERPLVVVADDVQQFSDFIQIVLETRKLSVTVVGNGDDLLELLTRRTPSAIVVDAFLPRLNALELAKILQERELDIPMVVMTANSTESDVMNRLEKAPRLVKPFTSDELYNAMRAVIPAFH